MIEAFVETVTNTPVSVAVLVGLLLYPIVLGACREIGSVYFLIKGALLGREEDDE